MRITDDTDKAQAFLDSNNFAYDAEGRQFIADDNGTCLTGATRCFEGDRAACTVTLPEVSGPRPASAGVRTPARAM